MNRCAPIDPQVLALLPLRVFWKDLELRYQGCNPLFAQAVGLEPADLLGKTDHELPWRDRAADLAAAESEVLASRAARPALIAPGRRASQDWEKTTLAPLFDEGGALVGLFGIVEDVTAEHAQLEEKIRREHWLQAVLDTLPYPFFAKDAGLRYSACNRAFEEFLGLPRERILGKTVFEVSPPEQAARYAQADQELVTGRSQQKYETTVRFADGTDREVVFHKAAVVRGNEFLGLVGFYFDLTELKRAEAQRRELEEQLRHAQRLESVGRLAGGVAHDLNNMLSPILGFAELLLADAPPESPQVSDLKEILEAAERARELVRRLMAFGRKQVLELKPVDLREVVRGFEKMLRRALRESVRLEFDLPAALPLANADVAQIEQVLMNLALNAQDAIPNAGTFTVRLGSHTSPGTAELPPGRYVLLEASDTGQGMDEATRAKAFEPFFTTKPLVSGSGLGLPTSLGIVKQHGGAIELTSAVGAGTTVRVYLPVLVEEARPAPAPSPAPAAPGGLTVLVVEDNDTVRRMTRRVLERGGYRVLCAEDGERALAVAQAEPGPIALLVTDVVMPGMNGKELHGRLAALRPGLKVLFTSGYDANIVAAQGVLGEGVHFIQKPFTVESMTRKVREVLAG